MKKNPNNDVVLRNMDVEDLLYLIHLELVKIADSLSGEDEESAPEQDGVMPADGMDPDAGGGEDIIPEEPAEPAEPAPEPEEPGPEQEEE